MKKFRSTEARVSRRMQIPARLSADSVPNQFFIKLPKPRPKKAFHLAFSDPISWTLARDTQNAIVKAYQSHHHSNSRRVLPPTFITLRFNPVFTYGRKKNRRPSIQERKMLEGLPEGNGLCAETRMAWGREYGWRFHGPGQIHCWMVADLRDWNVCPSNFCANISGKPLTSN